MSTSPAQPTGRHLSAVLHADMVDYSKVAAHDETLSMRCVAAIREAFAAAVPEHDGWFRAKAGDAVLALFPSAVRAVAAAVAIQQRLAAIRGQESDLPLWLRIGVHMGEVTPHGDDWHGDSINATARIQAESLPGGITVSSEVYRAVRNKMDLTCEDLGLHDLKGVGSFHLFRVVTGTERVERHGWPTRVLLRRRELTIGAVAALVLVLIRHRLIDWTGAQFSGEPDVAPPGAANPDAWPMTIGVMEIRPAGEAPEWMCDITHQGLNALLSKFDKLKVFSKDVIDWKKEKTGKRPFDIARELGMTRMISGELIRSGVKMTLQARIVDTQTGLQIDACEASGTEDKLVEIQNEVGIQLIHALRVPVTNAEIDKVLTARTNVDLDVTKRFAEAFGGDDDPPPAKQGPGAWIPAWPAIAYGAEADEQGVKQLLERYRAALEGKNLDQLAAIYVSLSDPTREALVRYFESAKDLTVRFSAVTVLFEGDEALATFTRSDTFKDTQTGRDVNLEVRVSTVVARADGAWKIKALRKPS